MSKIIAHLLPFALPAIAACLAASADEALILSLIAGAETNCREVAGTIFEFAELGGREFKSSALLKAELEKLGFDVAGDLQVPDDLVEDGIARTAFRAEMRGASPGVTAAIIIEYDALKNGHSCGHNLIGGAGLLAASALAGMMKNTPGRLLVIGTPDEERGSLGGGKVALLEGGHFEGVDVVITVHPSDRWNANPSIKAMKRASFVFHGKAAHVATAYKGVNALRAAICAYNAVDNMREHLRPDVRVHGIIKDGDYEVNVVPERAEIEFGVRASDTATMLDVYERLVNCAKAAELITGAKLEFHEPRVFIRAPIPLPAYSKLIMHHAARAGVPAGDIRRTGSLGSTDFGNVGNAYPAACLLFKIAPEGVSAHSDAFRDAAGSEQGWKAAALAARVMALTIHDLMTSPARFKAVRDQFDELKKAENAAEETP